MPLFQQKKPMGPNPAQVSKSNHEDEIKLTVKDIERRVKEAENASKKFIEESASSDLSLEQEKAYIDGQITVIKYELQNIRKQIKASMSNMSEFVKLLKLKAKKKEIEDLEDRTDEVKHENLITQKDFKKLLQDELST